MSVKDCQEPFIPPDTTWVISEAVFMGNHLTDTDNQNSTGK